MAHSCSAEQNSHADMSRASDPRAKAGPHCFVASLLISLSLSSGSQLGAFCVRIPDERLWLHLYNQSAASEQELTDLQRTVSEVFSHTSFTVFWVPSLSEGRSGIQRLEQSASKDISLTIVDRCIAFDRHTMGAATLETGRATVYYRRAQVLAHMADCPVSAGRIMGYVAAHEIAHLVLHSPQHSATGVLKSTWSRDDFRGMSQSRFWFVGEFSRR